MRIPWIDAKSCDSTCLRGPGAIFAHADAAYWSQAAHRSSGRSADGSPAIAERVGPYEAAREEFGLLETTLRTDETSGMDHR